MPRISVALLSLAAALPNHATEITIGDLSQSPTASPTQQTQINVLNDGGADLLPTVNGTVVYFVTTFTFGTDTLAHLRVNFNATGGQGRLGIEVQDSGFVQFINQNDPGDTTFNIATAAGESSTAGYMAGKTVTLLVKQEYNSSFDSLRATNGTSDDTMMTAWINPTVDTVEGSGLGAGDMQTLWNSAVYRFFTQTIQNQTTLATAGDSFITDTVILTGGDATFANALAIATGSTPPTGIVDAGTSTVTASPTAVPADGTTTSTITVTLKETGGSPVAGKEVSLAGNGSATIETANNISDANGVVTFTVKSGTVGTETFTATDVTDANLVITQTADVDFQTPVVVGPVDAGTSTVVASTSNVAANGIASATITVTLRDSSGLLVVGENVTLAGSPSGAAISPSATQTTDAGGQAFFTVSSTTIGPVVFTATSVTDNVTITQTAGVDFTEPQDAEAFNVKFLEDNPAQAPVTGLVGVVGGPGESWNQGYQSVSNLVDTTGTVVSSVGVSGLGNDGRLISGTSLSLFNSNRGLFDKGGDVTISITDLTPGNAYDLHIYALSHNTASWGDISSTERAAGDFVTSNTVLGNGQSQWLDNAVPGTNGNAFVPNGNYVSFESIVADGSGNISIVVDAYDGADGNPSTDDGDCRLHVCGLQIRPASGMSVDFMNWQTAYYPDLGLPDEDDDGDGLSNDYERIFGLDPTNPASASPYSTPFDRATGSFGYTRRSQALANLNYKVWYSTNLEDWFEDNAAIQSSQSVTNGVELMGVQIDPALLSQPKLFVQLRATPATGVDPLPSLINLWGSGNTITLVFSEPMNPSSAGNPANYTVVPTAGGSLVVTGATVSADGGSVTLTLGSTLGLDTGYTVSVDGVTSGTGQSLGSGVSRQFTTWDDNPNGVKVFIVAGQSNMVGFGETERGNGDVNGEIGSLRYRVLNNASFPDYDYTSLLVNPSDTSSAYRTRSDVKVWYRDGGNGNLGGAIKKGDLGPPFMGRDTGKIGPEFAFGQILGDFYTGPTEAPVLIVKTAWGGRDLVRDFRSPDAVANRGGQVGAFYSAMIDYTRQVLANLDTEFPEWSGQGYQIVGFGWHQGYNDRISASASDEYRYNLPDLVSSLRTLFNKPNLPIVVASTGMAIGAAEDPPYTGYSLVEKAQLWVAVDDELNPIPQPPGVLSTDTRPFWRAVGDSPTDQGFHWNQNGETLFMIGKAMGDNMVNLLGGP